MNTTKYAAGIIGEEQDWGAVPSISKDVFAFLNASGNVIIASTFDLEPFNDDSATKIEYRTGLIADTAWYALLEYCFSHDLFIPKEEAGIIKAKNTYSRTQHAFPYECGKKEALVYAGLHDPTDIYNNYVIEDHGEGASGGRYYLMLMNDQFASDDLESLEVQLFKYMESEGVAFDATK